MKKRIALLSAVLIVGNSVPFYPETRPLRTAPISFFNVDALAPEPIIQASHSHVEAAYSVRMQVGILLAGSGLGLIQGIAGPIPQDKTPAAAQTKTKKQSPAAPRKTIQAIDARLKELDTQRQKTQTALEHLTLTLKSTVETFQKTVPIRDDQKQTRDDLKPRPDVAQRMTEVAWLSAVADANTLSQFETVPPLAQALQELQKQLALLAKVREATKEAMATLDPKTREYTEKKTAFDREYLVAEELRLNSEKQMIYALGKNQPLRNIFQSLYYKTFARYSGNGQTTILLFKAQKKPLPQGGWELGLDVIEIVMNILGSAETVVATNYQPLPKTFATDVALQVYLDGKVEEKFDLASTVTTVYGPNAEKAWAMLHPAVLPSAVVTPVAPVVGNQSEAFQRLLAWDQPQEAADLTAWLASQDRKALEKGALDLMANIMDVMADTAGLPKDGPFPTRELFLAQSYTTAQELWVAHPNALEREKFLAASLQLKKTPAVITKQYAEATFTPGETQPHFRGRLIKEELERSLTPTVKKELPPAPQTILAIRPNPIEEKAPAPSAAPVMAEKSVDWITDLKNDLATAEKDSRLQELRRFTGVPEALQYKLFLAIMRSAGSALGYSKLPVLLARANAELSQATDEARDVLEPYANPSISKEMGLLLESTEERSLSVFYSPGKLLRIDLYVANANNTVTATRSTWMLRPFPQSLSHTEEKHTYNESSASHAYTVHYRKSFIFPLFAPTTYLLDFFSEALWLGLFSLRKWLRSLSHPFRSPFMVRSA